MSDLNQLNDFIKNSVNDFIDKKDINGDEYENRQDLIDNLECEIDRDLTPDVLNAIKYKVVMEILEYLNNEDMENEHIINPVRTYALLYGVMYYEEYEEKQEEETTEEENKKNFIALLMETGFKLI